MNTVTKLFFSISLLVLNIQSIPAFGQSQEKEIPSIIQTHKSPYLNKTDTELLDLIQKSTFQWFLDNADPVTGLIADRSGAVKAPATIAGTGFALTGYAIAAERHWISRSDAAAYTLKVVKGLYNTPQGLEKEGVSGYHGFFYHFLDPATGLRSTPPRYWYSELSSIDTALLMAGVIFARNYYTDSCPEETEIRTLCNALYERVDWPWLLTSELTLSHGYSPESGKIKYAYKGYSEAVLLYILAIGSAEHPIPAASWEAFIGDAHAERPTPDAQIMIMVPGMPLFTYQYPMAFIDFRGIRDLVTRRFGFDYFENSRRATWAQWNYARKNEAGKRGYNRLNWGLTASDGPGVITKEEQTFRAYSERGAPGGFDDGTIAPTAAISSIIYTPKIVMSTIRYWLNSRPELFNHHGFADAFNPSYDPATHSGWVDSDRLAIDQGPILMMIENYRTGLIWKVMRQDEQIKRGLLLAGFDGGWLRHLNPEL